MRINTTDYQFKHIYNIDTLKDYCRYAERDIQRLQELIEKTRQYQLDIYNHVQEVLNTPMKKYVTLDRSRNYSSNRVEYRVGLKIMPDIDTEVIEGNRVSGQYKDSKMFKGTERSKAFSYADELAKKYHCEIKKTGYWGKY